VEERIRKVIERFVRTYEQEKNTETRYRFPLIGFVSARDLLFHTLCDTLSGRTHPNDLLPDARSVVCYFIPF
jgi:hypothetical protein